MKKIQSIKEYFTKFMVMFVVTILSSIPLIASAKIIFTEIMYDAPGTDSKHEWIEVFNSGSEQVDLSTFDLIENDKPHQITSFKGGDILESGQYAIIADNAETFLLDNTGFSGLIFDSVFSLNNSGERLEIRDSQENITDSIIYNPEIGAGGNGNTLQKNGDTWISAEKTPGIKNKTSTSGEEGGSDVNTNQDVSTDIKSISSHSGQLELSDEKQKSLISIGAGRDRLGSPHNSMVFELNVSNESFIDSREFIWSFGDGDSKRGRNVNHTYLFPGTYSVVVQDSSGNLKATARTTVYIMNPDLSFIYHGDSLEIINKSNTEFNIGKIRIESQDNIFDISKDTIILGGANVHIPVNFYKDQESICNILEIKYPDGHLISHVFHKDLNIEASGESRDRIIKILSSPCQIDDKIKLLEISEN